MFATEDSATDSCVGLHMFLITLHFSTESGYYGQWYAVPVLYDVKSQGLLRQSRIYREWQQGMDKGQSTSV